MESTVGSGPGVEVLCGMKSNEFAPGISIYCVGPGPVIFDEATVAGEPFWEGQEARPTQTGSQVDNSDILDSRASSTALSQGPVRMGSVQACCASGAAAEQLAELKLKLRESQTAAAKSSAVTTKLKQERDAQSIQTKRLALEKNQMLVELRTLQQQSTRWEPENGELHERLLAAQRERNTLRSERGRLLAQVAALQGLGSEELAAEAAAITSPAEQPRPPPASAGSYALVHGLDRRQSITSLPSRRVLPAPEAAERPVSAASVTYKLRTAFQGHELPITNVTCHPSKPIMVTASDDRTWKMWHVPPDGAPGDAPDLIMCGEGHKDWLSSVDFHPKGTHLASGSGDSTVRIWQLLGKQKCTATLAGHTQAVWDIAFHAESGGQFLASCSLDRTVKLWDVETAKCRQTLKGHGDSVNEVCWQTGASALCTASSDKTISIWDPRSGLCSSSFFGHQNSCNSVAISPDGVVLTSADADGVLRVWDTRTVSQLSEIDTNSAARLTDSKQDQPTAPPAGVFPANRVRFDGVGEHLAVASDCGDVLFYSVVGGQLVAQLREGSPPDAVQAVAFDPSGQYLVSAGSDQMFRLWSV